MLIHVLSYQRYPTDVQVYFYRLHNSLIPEKAINKIIEAANRFYKLVHNNNDEQGIKSAQEVLYLTIQFLRTKGLVNESLTAANDFLEKEPEHLVRNIEDLFIFIMCID